MSNLNRIDLFDQWAQKYDQSIEESVGYPFDGYEEILDRMAELSASTPGMDILDLGTGTGNLLMHFVGKDVNLWGLDYSSEMLEKVKAKIPGGNFIEADVMGSWPDELGRKFDRIISAYVFHEFPQEQKIYLVQRIARTYLAEGGFFVIGDISFPNAEAQEIVRRRSGEEWDAEEYYWNADESIRALEEVGFSVQYEQISSCGGIYLIRPIKDSMTNRS